MFFAIRPKRTGNYKPGPGRPPGRKNNRTLELEAAAREAAAGIDGSFEGDAHAFLASVYKNPRLPLELRILAASRALRVEKPVLSTVHESRRWRCFGFGTAERGDAEERLRLPCV